MRSRASRSPARAALVAILLLATAVPASAAGPDVVVETAASPVRVTVGLPVAYVITVTNNTNNTLKYAAVSGETTNIDGTPLNLTYIHTEHLTYVPGDPVSCSQSGPSCVFDSLPSGATETAVFVFRAPALPTTFNFTALSDFDGDTSNPSAAHNDTVEDVIVTNVLGPSVDLVAGYSIPGEREFTTGIGPLDTTNQHGTRVRIGVNAEVTLADLPPNHVDAKCPSQIAATCFGWGSSLSIANGALIPGGIEVTMRWDFSELPKGMTPAKLRIAHLTGTGPNGFVQVKDACVYGLAGVPTNMPCISVAPFRMADKDIQASFYLASNRVSRGY